jgi:hypothetical protein
MLKPSALATLIGVLSLALPAAATSNLPRLELKTQLLTMAQDDLYDDDVLGDSPAAQPARVEDGARPAGSPGESGQVIGQSVGGATGFVHQTGFYTMSDLGGFVRFGGWADGEACGFRCVQRPWSNLQPYIGLAMGYDIFDWLAVQGSFGTGFVANAAPVALTPNSPRDFGITFVNVAVVGTLWLDRFGISGKVFGGGALLQPAPLPDELPLGGNVGAGIGLRWATLLPGVTVGADVNGYAVIAQGGGEVLIIPGLSFAPVIKYVF